MTLPLKLVIFALVMTRSLSLAEEKPSSIPVEIFSIHEDLKEIPDLYLEYNILYDDPDMKQSSPRKRRFIKMGSCWRDDMYKPNGDLIATTTFDGYNYFDHTPEGGFLVITDNPEHLDRILLNSFSSNPVYKTAMIFFRGQKHLAKRLKFRESSAWIDEMKNYTISPMATETGEGRRFNFDSLDNPFEVEFKASGLGSLNVTEIYLKSSLYNGERSYDIRSRISYTDWQNITIGEKTFPLCMRSRIDTRMADGSIINTGKTIEVIKDSIRPVPVSANINVFRVPLSAVKKPVIQTNHPPGTY